MSPALPPETFDTIIDHLHDEPATLKTCCTVSKSWVPRARKHLFAHVELNTTFRLKAWKSAFPDPSNSPAHYTLSLSIYGAPDAVADVDDWIHAFRNVEQLLLGHMDRSPLVPFYAISPAVRLLYLTYTTTDVFDLICSFPLLEDLVLFNLHSASEADLHPGYEAGWNPPSTSSPKLTGSLDLRTTSELYSIVHGLCAFPNGLHFTKITVGFGIGNIDPILDLVSMCSDTLESLTVSCFIMLGTSRALFLDLSEATKLKHLTFRWGSLNVARMVTAALQTMKSKTLQHITIHPAAAHAIEDTLFQEWQDLDRLLVQFWTPHPGRIQVIYEVNQRDLRDHMPSLLPELTTRGLVDLVEATD